MKPVVVQYGQCGEYYRLCDVRLDAYRCRHRRERLRLAQAPMLTVRMKFDGDSPGSSTIPTLEPPESTERPLDAAEPPLWLDAPLPIMRRDRASPLG